MKKLTTEEQFYLPAKLVETTEILNLEDSTTMPYNSHAVVVEMPSGPKIVNFCSEKYGLVKNSEIFPEIEKLLDEDYIYKKVYRHRDNCVFWADYTLQGRDLLVGAAKFDDKVQPIIRIMHSYNGSVRYRAVMGFRRQICTNGLWGHVFDTQVDLRHSQGNLTKIFSETIEGVKEFVEKADEFKLQYDEMTNNLVQNVDEFVELIINSSMFPKRQKEAVIDRVKIESSSHNLPISDWLVYNAFNYQLNHNDEFSNDEVHRMKIDNQVLRLITKGEQQGNKLVIV